MKIFVEAADRAAAVEKVKQLPDIGFPFSDGGELGLDDWARHEADILLSAEMSPELITSLFNHFDCQVALIPLEGGPNVLFINNSDPPLEDAAQRQAMGIMQDLNKMDASWTISVDVFDEHYAKLLKDQLVLFGIADRVRISVSRSEDPADVT